MKALAIPPYHLFRYRGTPFAFDINTSHFLKVSEAAYDYLQARLDGSGDPDAYAAVAAKHGQEQAEKLKGEMALLRSKGYFKKQAFTYDDRDNEKLIRSLVKRRTNKIELYLAEACNLRCKYCYVGDNDALNNGLMPLDVALAAVDLVFERCSGDEKEISVTFLGGEPLLNKPVMKAVIAYSQERIRNNGMEKAFYSLTTNATLLDDEVIDYIKKYNFGLMISIDGPREVHDAMRPMANGKGSFDRAASNVKRLMGRRRMVTVRCTLSNRYLDIPALVSFFEAFGFTRIGFATCRGKSYGRGPYDLTDEDQAVVEKHFDDHIDRFFKQLATGEQRKFDPYSQGIRDFHNHKTARFRCGACRGCTTVGIDGALYPCHRYVGMKEFIIGDVWNGVDDDKHAAYLRGYLESKKKCEQCWAVHICGGVCPWFVSHEDGSFVPPSDAYCDRIRRSFEKTAWLAYEVAERYPKEYAKIVGIEWENDEAPDRAEENEEKLSAAIDPGVRP
jgi:uncharacterized protein